MKPKKDIFDLFRENEHKLNERPSRKAWKRLEDRLDTHKVKNRRSIYRILSYAAAILVLVVSITLIGTFLQSPTPTIADQAAKSFEVEDLTVVSVSNEHYYKVQEYQRTHKDRLANPISEGEAHKKLIAKMNFDRRDGNLNSFIAKSRRENNQSQQESSDQPVNQKPEIGNKNRSEALESDLIANIEIPQIESSKENELPVVSVPSVTDEVGMDAMIMNEEESIAQEEDIVIAKAKPQTAPLAAKSQDDIAQDFMEGRSAEKSKSTKMDSGSVQPQNSAGIEQFQWLTGKWEGNVNNQVSIEQWKQLDANSLQGTGFLIADGENTFNESMKIKVIDQRVYFIADLDGSGKVISYKLISNDGFEAVFENKTVNFPKQIILRRNNSTNFSTIYQNAQPASIDEGQQDYLNRRNIIQKEQVIRNLQRVDN